jgi:hypothetical protein
MQEIPISVNLDGQLLKRCEACILIPEIAIKEQGFIQALTIKDTVNAKHDFHAIAQTAYFLYQDKELGIVEIEGELTIAASQGNHVMEAGVVLCRGLESDLVAFVQKDQNIKRLLEAGYRYCTRWVRLDI